MHNITALADLRALYGPAGERSVKKELPALDVHATRFIGLSPLVVVSSTGPGGAMDASPRGGEPGFVKVTDAHTLLLADSPGNNRLDTLQNLLHSPHIGLLFLVPGVDETLRVNGTAVLSVSEADRALCQDARRVPKLVIRVTVQASYLHCAKALMRSDLWNPARHQPRTCLPSMGEMLRDQIAGDMAPGTPFETQEQMLERYRQTL
ncbi:MAG: pyridoxamine 5'-phosphate oxidase family protein [Ramlibacter sp.]|nr:pyridoxamine 5'-phosphate oxidase family protein [Ramlibacter sp.]